MIGSLRKDFFVKLCKSANNYFNLENSFDESDNEILDFDTYLNEKDSIEIKKPKNIVRIKRYRNKQQKIKIIKDIKKEISQVDLLRHSLYNKKIINRKESHLLGQAIVKLNILADEKEKILIK